MGALYVSCCWAALVLTALPVLILALDLGGFPSIAAFPCPGFLLPASVTLGQSLCSPSQAAPWTRRLHQAPEVFAGGAGSRSGWQLINLLAAEAGQCVCPHGGPTSSHECVLWRSFPLRGFFLNPKNGNYLLNLICLIFLLKNEVQLRCPEKP